VAAAVKIHLARYTRTEQDSAWKLIPIKPL